MVLAAPDGAIVFILARFFGRKRHDLRVSGTYLAGIHLQIRDCEAVHDAVDIPDPQLDLFTGRNFKLELTWREISFLGRASKNFGGETLRQMTFIRHASYDRSYSATDK
jgi:hypothetical protein